MSVQSTYPAQVAEPTDHVVRSAPDEADSNPAASEHLPVGRNVKIGFFHLGSGMADVLTTGVWNRIMISDLGFAATPVGLLVSLRYFLTPLSVWAGRMSDRHTVGGYRRLFWIWLGRAMMVASVFGLGWQTAQLVDGAAATALTWGVLALSLLTFSLGNALSGSTFLALIYDRAPEHQRGRAVGIVWTFLLLGFTTGGILFGVMLPEHAAALDRALLVPGYALAALDTGPDFTGDVLLSLFAVTGLLLGSLWFFSLFGEEQRVRRSAQSDTTPDSAPRTSLREDLALVWRSRSMRFFLAYLTLSMLFAFSQDLILEPFAGDVFDMSASTTNRFAAYWGSMAILGTLAFLFLSRRVSWLTNSVMSSWGVIILFGTFLLFALSAFAEVRGLVTPGLIALGVGLGIWNVGTLGMMMDMSPAGRAGTFLGFWTLAVTLSRGLGVSSGGILRDLALTVTGSPSAAYGTAFALGAVGLALAWFALRQIGVQRSDERQADTAGVFAGAMD